jgi:uncharacterized membrane protein YbhN (UPF0104 family)
VKTVLKNLIKILFSLILLGYFLSHAGIEETWKSLSGANLSMLPLGVGLYLLAQWLSSLRWKALSGPFRLGHLPIGEFFRLYLVGMFFSLFLPGAMGGDVLRAVFLASKGGEKKRLASLTVLAERGVGLLTLLCITTFACWMPETASLPSSVRNTLSISLACLLGLYALVLIARPPLARWANRYPLLEPLVMAESCWRDLRLVGWSFCLSLLVHAACLAIHWGIAWAMGMEQRISLPYLIAAFGMTGLSSILPLSFNGIGVREGTYVLILSQAGWDRHVALAFGLYWLLISILTSLVGGLCYVLGDYRLKLDADSRQSLPESLREPLSEAS